MTPSPLLPDLKTCIPQKGPMQLVDRYVQFCHAEKICIVECVIKEGKRYLSPSGEFQDYWLLEIMAQATAGHFYLQSAQEGKPKRGYLISIQSYELVASVSLAVGDLLQVQSEEIASLHPIGKYQSQVRYHDRVIATALMTFVVDAGGEHY